MTQHGPLVRYFLRGLTVRVRPRTLNSSLARMQHRGGVRDADAFTDHAGAGLCEEKNSKMVGPTQHVVRGRRFSLERPIR